MYEHSSENFGLGITIARGVVSLIGRPGAKLSLGEPVADQHHPALASHSRILD